MKKNTIIQQSLALRSAKEAEICELLGWTSEEMFWFKIDACTAYMEYHFKHLSTFLLGEKKIWNWWLNQWAIRDMSFLNKYKFEPSTVVLQDEYNFYNSVHAIMASPRYKMLQSNLTMTIDKVIAKEERKVQYA